ncbi:hypothetical protein JTB14_012399 [Gonioctena quinquepunctata]|nr:hypothetical protein JTB14_012399 [Gonioctena quinquepunctata]
MYCLVRFIEDKVWHVCKENAVRGNLPKWVDGHRYEAETIARSRGDILREISKNLGKKVPIILLPRIGILKFLKVKGKESANISTEINSDKNPDATEVVSSGLDPYLETDSYQNVPQNKYPESS